MLKIVLAIFVCICAPFAATLASAQDPRPEVHAVRLCDTDTVVLDGAPNEAVWQKAMPATNFLQRDPDNGQPAAEQTEVRVLSDSDRIILDRKNVEIFAMENNRGHRANSSKCVSANSKPDRI